MLVCHASDLHGDWDQLFSLDRTPDCFVLTGDMLHNCGARRFKNRRDVEQEATGQLKDLEDLLPRFSKVAGDIPVVSVAGNHDYVDLGTIMAERGFNAQQVSMDLQTVPGTDISFAGFPNINLTGANWNHEADPATMNSLANTVLDNNPDWLVTHCGPSGILASNPAYGNPTLTSRLTYDPGGLAIHFFGHDHEPNGTVEQNGVLFSNAATTINWINT